MESISEWGEGWLPVTDGGKSFAAELAKEAGPGHPLRGAKVQVLGRCRACDDIVAAVPGRPEDPELAVIHLTYRGSAEGDSRWPYFERVSQPAFIERFVKGGEHL